MILWTPQQWYNRHSSLVLPPEAGAACLLGTCCLYSLHGCFCLCQQTCGAGISKFLGSSTATGFHFHQYPPLGSLQELFTLKWAKRQLMPRLLLVCSSTLTDGLLWLLMVWNLSCSSWTLQDVHLQDLLSWLVVCRYGDGNLWISASVCLWVDPKETLCRRFFDFLLQVARIHGLRKNKSFIPVVLNSCLPQQII